MQVQETKSRITKKFADPKLNGLTELQSSTIEYIDEFIRTQQLPPTIREIALYYGVTTKTISGRLLGIERKGFLKILPRISRGIILTESARLYLAESRDVV
ncbi:hypothetical protein EHR03_13030 [Leptospira mayottensis]|uniref:LexA repressor DNA-binding domain-containing protein n=1 Tax=Leptospira mayottensis 200901116 TaxID=1192864 RepID=A0A343US14_9LEPT|nr:hypothetical protein [Leptospira mayottensis 200901116]TGN00348.1 hypothetical protein EHR03_13030 [Leptospira mayottensis]